MVQTDKRFLERSEATEASIQRVHADATNKPLSPPIRARLDPINVETPSEPAPELLFFGRCGRSGPALRFLPGRLRLPQAPDKQLRRRLLPWRNGGIGRTRGRVVVVIA